MKKSKLIYVYDAHCSWCFAFSEVMLNIQKKYNTEFDYEVISGGMIVGDKIGPIREAAPPNILEIYEQIEQFTGTAFGKEYLTKVAQGDSLRNSEIPAAALSAFKNLQPKNALSFAHAIQYKLFIEALEIDDDALYESLAREFKIEEKAFLSQMQQSEFQDAARYDFALAKQLQVTGYPQLLVQTDATHFFLIAKGYTDFETLDGRVQQVLAQIEKN